MRSMIAWGVGTLGDKGTQLRCAAGRGSGCRREGRLVGRSTAATGSATSAQSTTYLALRSAPNAPRRLGSGPTPVVDAGAFDHRVETCTWQCPVLGLIGVTRRRRPRRRGRPGRKPPQMVIPRPAGQSTSVVYPGSKSPQRLEPPRHRPGLQARASCSDSAETSNGVKSSGGSSVSRWSPSTTIRRWSVISRSDPGTPPMCVDGSSRVR